MGRYFSQRNGSTMFDAIAYVADLVGIDHTGLAWEDRA